LSLSSGHPSITDFGQARPTGPALPQQTPHKKYWSLGQPALHGRALFNNTVCFQMAGEQNS